MIITNVTRFFSLAATVFVTVAVSSCSQNGSRAAAQPATSQTNPSDSSSKSGGKAIVCYFSATGTTADVAGRLARIAGADLFEITPEVRYSAADLDWTDTHSRSYIEMHNREMRPAIVNAVPEKMDSYEVVYIGYPNWWNTAPTIINTFIESNDLAGKKIRLFMTSGGSGISGSEKDLKAAYPELAFDGAMLMNNVTDGQIRGWVNRK